MTKIELDELRISKFQKLRNNLEVVKEYFRHGDILIREVNITLEETRNLIDSTSETSFTQEDFDDMLNIRNEVLSPIFQSASFAQEFIPYSNQYIPPSTTVDMTPVENTTTNISEGVLYTSNSRTSIGGKLVKEVNTKFLSGIPSEINTVEYLNTGIKTTTLRYSNNIENYKVVTTVTENVIETLTTNYENNVAISTTYNEYIDGILIETLTTIL